MSPLIQLKMTSNLQSDDLTRVFRGLKSSRDEERHKAAIELKRYVTTSAQRVLQHLTRHLDNNDSR